MGALEHPPILSLPGIPEHVTYTWVAMAILVAIALLHFRWLARGAAGALRGEGGFALGLTGLGLRSAGAFGALALTLAGGWVHPLAVIAGLSVLPPVLLAAGARSAG